MSALALLAVAGSAACAAAGARLLVRPRRPLAQRVRPYAVPALVAQGLPVDAQAVDLATGSSWDLRDQRWSARVRSLAAGLLLRRAVPPELLARLRWSGRYDGTDAELLAAHRARQLTSGVTHAAAAGVLAQLAGAAPLLVVLLAAAGVVSGASRPVAAVDRAVRERTQAMRAELGPLAMLLAIRLQASSSPTSAMTRTVGRTQGQLRDEMAAALRRHRAGEPLDVALTRVGRMCDDPDVATFWRILSSAVRDGVDAAGPLRRLADDTRQRTLMQLRADATRRRAAMLLPTIGLLAPQMLIFVAAPLPSLLTGIR